MTSEQLAEAYRIAYKVASVEAPVKYGLSSAAAGATIVPFLYWLMTDRDKFRWQKALGSSIIGAMAGGSLGVGAGMVKKHIAEPLGEAANRLTSTADKLNGQLEKFNGTNENVNEMTDDLKGMLKEIREYGVTKWFKESLGGISLFGNGGKPHKGPSLPKAPKAPASTPPTEVISTPKAPEPPKEQPPVLDIASLQGGANGH